MPRAAWSSSARAGRAAPAPSDGLRGAEAVHLERQVMLHLKDVVVKRLRVGAEAQRQLLFFCNSLHNRRLRPPPPVRRMKSWSAFTPHYGEDVTYSMGQLTGPSFIACCSWVC